MKDNSLALDLIGKNLSERHLAWFYNKLYNFPLYEVQPRPLTRDEYYQALHELINRRHFSNLAERNAFIKKMSAKCEASLLSESAFGWIEKRNSRLCYWLWFYLGVHHRMNPMITPPTSEAMLKDIIGHFDLMDGSTYEKLSLLNELRTLWTEISQGKDVNLDWLIESDPLQCSWALRYLEKKKMELKLPPVAHELLMFMKPYHRALITVDLWHFAPEKRSQFVHKMKLAWKQQAMRSKEKKNAGKVRVRLSDKHLVMLEAVSSMYEHQSPTETLGILIETEYQKLKGSWQKRLP